MPKLYRAYISDELDYVTPNRNDITNFSSAWFTYGNYMHCVITRHEVNNGIHEYKLTFYHAWPNNFEYDQVCLVYDNKKDLLRAMFNVAAWDRWHSNRLSF